MQSLLCITVIIAVISGVNSRTPVHSSPRNRGPYFWRPQTNQISSLRPGSRQRPSGPDFLCRFGAYKRDCCYGWKRNEVGACIPICEKPCDHGSCVGPNRCKCESGWTGPTCSQDYNECSVRPCGHRCMNTPGSYRCYCDHGFILLNDGHTCSRDDRCYSTRCAFGCVQYDDGFVCFCPQGLKITADGLGCQDVDECEEGIANCPRGRRCSNTYGNYLCLCQEGFKFQYVGGKLSCVDDDECAANSDKCDVNAYCENLSGGYRCVCKPGFVGTGEKCLRIGRETCADRPCFEGVKCSDIRINVNELDYESEEEAKRFVCGPCPPGHVGDGVDCVASNVDVTILVLEQIGGAPVADVKIRALDVRSGGATEFATAFSGINGVAKLPVPNDANIIVVAIKDGHPTTSTTFDVRNNENNLITLTLGAYNDGVVFPYPLPVTRTFSFGDPNSPGGQLQVDIPAGGLNVSDGALINLDIRTIDVSDPQTVQNVPEMAARTAEQGSEPQRLEALAVAEIEVTDSKTREKVDLTEAATIRIPISNSFDSLSVGDTVPAWYFDEAIGLWVQDGVGNIEEDGNGGLTWVYQTEHFTWWAAALVWPGMQLVKVKTCFTEECDTIAPHTSVQVWGADYFYQANLITTREGYTLTFLKTNGNIKLIHECSKESIDYNITPAITEIIYKVPDTVNLGCLHPGEVQNGVRIGDDFQYGSEVTYYCNPGYTMHGSSRRICTSCGEWSGYQPYCEMDDNTSSYISSSIASSEPEISTPNNQMFTPEAGSGDGPI